MAFCNNCGTQNQDGAPYCVSCGQPLGAAPIQQGQPQVQQPYPPQPQQPYQQQPQQPYQQQPQQPYPQQPQQPYQQQPQQPPYQQPPQQPYPQQQYPQQYQQQPQQGYIPPGMPGAPPLSEAQDIQANKGMAIIAYILFFVPLLTGAHKTSPYARFHTNQGTVLFIVYIGWGIVYSILTAIFTAILLFSAPGLLIGLTAIFGILWLAPVALCVMGIINAAQGKTKPLPVIGKFKILK